MTGRMAWLFPVLAAAACAQGPPSPAPLDTRNEACGFCRMALSDPRFAAQLVAASEEPRFFDDVGCLRDYLAAVKSRPAHLVAYVADHRTKAWVSAERAVYVKVDALETPMGSHLIAHVDALSRDADPDARGGLPLSAADVFGPSLPERRTR
jgi:copper chaperone NosL